MNIEKSLINIGLSTSSARIYMRLLEVKRASARELAEHTGMTRPSVYDNLALLLEQGLVTEIDEDNKKIFHIDGDKSLTGYIDSHIELLTKEKNDLVEAFSRLPSIEIETPSIKSYSGVDGIKRILNEMLWYENIETRTVWPVNDMAEVLGDEFLADLNRKRIKRNMSIKSIWPTDELASLEKYPFLGAGKEHLRERRIAPEGMKWSMSYWQYADRVAFISSHKESFGFVVQSNDFVSLIKANFEGLWQISKPVATESSETESAG